MFCYVRHNFKTNLQNALRTKDPVLIADIVGDEVAKLIIFDKNKLINTLNRAGIKLKEYNKKTITKAVVSGLKANDQLRTGLLELIMKNNHDQKTIKATKMSDLTFCFDSELSETAILNKTNQHQEAKNEIDSPGSSDRKEIFINIMKSVGIIGGGLLLVGLAANFYLSRVISATAVPEEPAATQPEPEVPPPASVMPPPKVEPAAPIQQPIQTPVQ